MLLRRLATRLLVPLVALGGGLGGVLVTASPASAAVTGTLGAADFTLSNSCRHQPVTYDLAVSPGTVLWQVKMSLVSPAGTSSEGVDLSSTDGDPLSGTIQFLICGSSTPGTYAVRTTGFSQVVPLVNLPIDVADTTFEVRRAPTRTRVAATHLRGDRYRVVTQVTDQRRRGFKPTGGAEVVLERKVDGVWTRIRGSRSLTDRGVARAVVSVPQGTRVRAVTAPDGYLAGSTSRSVKLRR